MIRRLTPQLSFDATQRMPIRMPCVDIRSLDMLPAPVVRYFRYALADGQAMVRSAYLHEYGTLRTSTHSRRWLSFDAEHFVSTPVPAFAWNARVAFAPLLRLHVRDSYRDGHGSAAIRLFSLRLAGDRGCARLDAASLQRYLAEAVWYPTALLPQAGVRWRAIDDRRALATLTDRGITVSLEFRFGEDTAISGVFAAGRWMRGTHGYRQLPWEGHFGEYTERQGMRVPLAGEVGWHEHDAWREVWKANVDRIEYGFAQTAAFGREKEVERIADDENPTR